MRGKDSSKLVQIVKNNSRKFQVIRVIVNMVASLKVTPTAKNGTL